MYGCLLDSDSDSDRFITTHLDQRTGLLLLGVFDHWNAIMRSVYTCYVCTCVCVCVCVCVCLSIICLLDE